MLKITIDDRAVLAALDTLQRRVSNMSQVMHDIGRALMEGSRRRIAQGRDWTGAPFAPNSPVTLARKSGNRPLINRSDFMDQRLFYQASRNQVIVGASAVQSAVLQFGARRWQFGATRRGAPIPWGDIPARRYLPVTASGQLDEPARALILDTIANYLADAVR